MKQVLLPALAAGLLLGVVSLDVHGAAVPGQGTWESTLKARDLDGDSSTGEAYYDTTLDITWLADANAGIGSPYDTLSPGSGIMTWNPASAWATSLDPYGSGVTGWRLPETNPVNGTAYHFGRPFDGTSDEGYNVSAPGTTYAGSTGSEMAHLFYNTLGNLADYDTTGRSQSGGGLTNTGPFSNLQSYHYWSATTDPRDTTRAWNFFMPDGSQLGYSKSSESFAWAVHAGDVGTAVVPVPAALWLFVGGLVSLAGLARRHAAEG